MINLKELPTDSGCYLFKDSEGAIIYIGKAKNLRKRVSSYFQKKDHDPKTKQLVSQIKDLDFIVTKTEVEAFVLENNLIKKHKPKYNIDLKDSKKYAFIEITDEQFPRLLVARSREAKGKLFGPFVSAESRDYILNFLRRTFKIRTCKILPKKKCIRYDIGLCTAPCINKISKKDYNEDIKSIQEILNGKISSVVSALQDKMKKASDKKQYEKAMLIRDQISAIRGLRDKQMVERQKKYNEDVINFEAREGKVYLIVFNVHKGVLESKEEFVFDKTENFFEEFLARYYSGNFIPKEIIVPKQVSDPLRDYVNKIAKKKVNFVFAQKGDKKLLLDLVKQNIEASNFAQEKKLAELRNRLDLQEIPNVIECFDISHLSGEEIVGSMVQFRGGLPDKRNYRKFKVKSVTGIDDFASIKEIVYRRYYRIVKEKGELPNLIVIDGGRGQLNFAMKALDELRLKIPTIGLAKREEEIYMPNGEILRLDKKNQGLLLLIRIRDEAHRFAIKFQRERRGKKLFG
jgi:excinuclease ABC subunit C